MMINEIEDLFCCCSCRKPDNSEAQIDVNVAINEWDLRRATDGIIRMNDDYAFNDYSTNFYSRISRAFQAILLPSPRNRLALELYGNEKEIKKEQKRQEEDFSTRWMIHPFSHLRSYWDLVMLVLSALTLVILPISVTYWRAGATGTEWELDYRWVIVNVLIDCVFIIDIIMNFRTGIVSHENAPNQVILFPRVVASFYLRGWFMIDFLSSIPLDEFVLIVTKVIANQNLHWLKLLSLFKLLRVSRLIRYINRWEELLDISTDGVTRLTKHLLFSVLLIHWIACMQYLIPSLQGVPSNSWIAMDQIQTSPSPVQYSWSVFRAVSHMLCIGYGKWPPQTVTEAWMIVTCMMLGALIYVLLIGDFIVLFLPVDASGRQYSEKLQGVKQYMHHLKLPKDIKTRVLSYYKHRFYNKPFNEDQIMSELSPGLQEDIAAHTCKDMVKAVPFFQNIPDQFISQVIKHLKFLVFMKDENIIHAGGLGDGMYFVKAGVAQVLVNGKSAAMLYEGSHFGEMSLLTDDTRVADVIAFKTTDAYFLSKEIFNTLLDGHPELREQFQDTALKRLNKNEKKSLSFLESSASYRPKINTSGVFQSSIVINNVSSTEATNELETIDISGPSGNSGVKRFISEPNGKRKLPPIGVKKFSQ